MVRGGELGEVYRDREGSRGGRGRGGEGGGEGGKRNKNGFFTYLYFLWFFWFVMYIPTVHDKFFALKIEIQYNCSTFFIFYSRGNVESGSFTYMRNSVCRYRRNSAEFRGIPGIFTAKNTAEFRGIPRNSGCLSQNSVFRRKSKTHFRGHPRQDTLDTST